MKIKIAVEFKDASCTIYSIVSQENNFRDRVFGLRKYLTPHQISKFNKGIRIFNI